PSRIELRVRKSRLAFWTLSPWQRAHRATTIGRTSFSNRRAGVCGLGRAKSVAAAARTQQPAIEAAKPVHHHFPEVSRPAKRKSIAVMDGVSLELLDHYSCQSRAIFCFCLPFLECQAFGTSKDVFLPGR